MVGAVTNSVGAAVESVLLVLDYALFRLLIVVVLMAADSSVCLVEARLGIVQTVG
jgi:hypothetical protein